MNLIQADIFQPWRAVNRLHRDVDRFFLPLRFPGVPAKSTADAAWVPAVDIREEDDRFVIHADVPGVDPKELNITMEQNVLCLQGTRETHATESDGGVHRAERVRGQFRRSFSLPETADPEGIAAQYRDGVLELAIAKRRQAEPRRIEISTG